LKENTMLDAFVFDWIAWWATVPREVAFLMALPFVVAAVALLADCLRRVR
jgi:hypothetical protein